MGEKKEAKRGLVFENQQNDLRRNIFIITMVFQPRAEIGRLVLNSKYGFKTTKMADIINIFCISVTEHYNNFLKISSFSFNTVRIK